MIRNVFGEWELEHLCNDNLPGLIQPSNIKDGTAHETRENTSTDRVGNQPSEGITE